jgi:hypothetical protein
VTRFTPDDERAKRPEGFQTDADGHLALMRFYIDVRTLAGEAVDCGFDDLPELRLKLDGIVAACSEVLVRAERIQDAQAERMTEPPDSGWVHDWNGRR